MTTTTAGKKGYSLVVDPEIGTTNTGLDQIVGRILADPGLAGANDSKDIKGGASAADALNQLIIKAAEATGAVADKVFTVEDVVKMNAWIRTNALEQWTTLHGDDEDGAETGYHLVQNDGANIKYRGENFVNTVADGIYHMGFEIRDGRFLNEDGDPNASVQQVADWLTQFYVDHSTTGTALDKVTDLIMADKGLDCRIPDAEITKGADAADGMNHMLADTIAATGILADNDVSVADVVALNAYLRADPARAAEWAKLHGDDEKGSETGYHLVQNDGASTTFFGQNLVNTVADGIYHLGFEIKDGRLLNEDGDTNARVSDVASWLNYFVGDQSTTGTGLDHIVDWIKEDRGLSRNTSATDIVDGLKAADGMNKIIADLIAKTGATSDGWITQEEVRTMNGLIRSDANALKEWTMLHGDDEDGSETGYHLIQNDGANTNFLGRNLVNTVADGIYHMGFEIEDGRFLNEDGNANATVADVATWLNYFYKEATIVSGDGNANALTGDERAEQINAGGGDDTVNAGAGNDLVYGSWGNDAIAGDDGDDLIYAGGGNDSVSGGDGDDVFRVTGTSGTGFEGYDSYDGGAGTDTIVAYGEQADIGLKLFAATNGIEVIDASAAINGARALGDWKDNVLDFSGVKFVGKVTIDGGGGNDTITGSTGNDIIEGGGWGRQTIYGGAGDDIIHAGSGNDRVSGGDGDDVFRITGNPSQNFEGYDSYDGGTGKDTILASGGDVVVGMASFGSGSGIEVIDFSGATGAGRIQGDWTDDTFDFSATTIVGKVSIDGGGGSDTIIGTIGDDMLVGNSGNDRLAGGLGNDLLTGGNGGDTFAFGTAWGHDTVTDFRRGVDKLDLRDAGVNQLAELSITQVNGSTVISFDGNDVALQGVTSSLTASDFIFA